MDAELIELIKTPTRYRYYKISSPLVANALESLSILLPVNKQSHQDTITSIMKFVLQEFATITLLENLV